jgi:hypothetical protein
MNAKTLTDKIAKKQKELDVLKKEELSRIIAIESVLIELMLRDRRLKDGDPDVLEWSSRVQADRIYEIANGTSTEKVKKPWAHFAVGEPCPPLLKG